MERDPAGVQAAGVEGGSCVNRVQTGSRLGGLPLGVPSALQTQRDSPFGQNMQVSVRAFQ